MKPAEAVIQGTLKSDGRLELDENLNLPPGRVVVTVRAIEPDQPKRSVWEVLEDIRLQQEARGFKGRAKEEIDAEVREIREESEYERRWAEIESQTQPPREDVP